MSHKAWCLNTASGHGSHLGEGHSKRCHACILTVCDNHAIGKWLDTADTLEASAGSHRILHDGVQSNMLQSTLGIFLYCFINILVRAQIYINRALLGDYQACQEAEVPFVFASYGFGQVDTPDYVIEKPMDLLTLF